MADTREAPLANAPEFSVSDLSRALKGLVEDAFGYVRVRGEISGYRGPHSSGHAYFSLKDENARLDAVIWKGVFGRLPVKPEEGMEVIATGRLTTFAGKSSYQIVVDRIEPAGIGALMALVEERRRRLQAEGLFDPARKQLLPFLPTVIGVVTSPTGAVIRDILHRLADRFPRRVILWPVRVQGETCGAEVTAAIEGFNALPEGGPIPRPDVIIVARGGGSLEDLWGFNDESVVRAAANSDIPLVSAVGHETDVTLIDFAADVRAPTPTAAAEMVVPVRAELLNRVTTLDARLLGGLVRLIEARRVAWRAAARALPTADALLAQRRQRLDLLDLRLAPALAALGTAKHRRLDAATARLTVAPILQRRQRQFDQTAAQLSFSTLREANHNRAQRLEAVAARGTRAVETGQERRRRQLDGLAMRLDVQMRRRRDWAVDAGQRLDRGMAMLRRALEVGTARRADALGRAAALLETLSYRSVLARGYALVRGPAGEPLPRAAAVPPGANLTLEFADGTVAAKAAGSAPPTRPKPKAADQGALF